MQITVLFTLMLATMDQMGTVVSLSTVPLEKLLLVNSWIYQDQRDCQDTQRGSALPHCIVADEAFPLRMDLMRPYPCGKKKNRLAYDKSIFNYRLSRARRIVENAFSILAQRFRVFDRRIHMDDHNVIKIVNATCVLHNYLCTARMDVANVMGRLNPDGAPYLQPQAMLRELQNQGYHSTDAAHRVRRIYKDYFNSEVGAVPWQGN